MPDILSDGSLAFRPAAVIEVGHVPILHPGWQSDVTESPVLVLFQLVLLLSSINRRESPDPFFRQRFAKRLPVRIPFLLFVDGPVAFHGVRCADDVVVLVLPGFCGGNVMIPEGSCLNGNHISLELAPAGRRGHGLAECLIFTLTADFPARRSRMASLELTGLCEHR